MKPSVALFSAAAILCGVPALAGPPKPQKTKLVDVWTCPIQQAPANKKLAAVVYGKYRVHFCCGGCPEMFSKLSDKDKQAKIAAALKKDKSAKKA